MTAGEAKLFQGIHAVLFALFDAEENLDHAAMTAQVEYCIGAGCNGITVPGLATEVLKLTPDERGALVTSVGKAVAGRVPYSVTVAGNSVAEQIALGRIAADAGADWLILQPPMTGNYEAGIYLDFFARVAGGLELPVAIQNAPQYLGRALSAEDITRLRDRSANIIAVKSEDTAAEIGHIIRTAGDDFHVLGGRGGQEMIDSLSAGCGGFVLAPDFAPVAVRIFALWQADDSNAAGKLYADAVPAIAFSMESIEHLITYGKRIMGANAGIAIHDRAPCLTPTPSGLNAATGWAKHLRKLAR